MRLKASLELKKPANLPMKRMSREKIHPGGSISANPL
jgi:hypothetical protein